MIVAVNNGATHPKMGHWVISLVTRLRYCPMARSWSWGAGLAQRQQFGAVRPSHRDKVGLTGRVKAELVQHYALL